MEAGTEGDENTASPEVAVKAKAEAEAHPAPDLDHDQDQGRKAETGRTENHMVKMTIASSMERRSHTSANTSSKRTVAPSRKEEKRAYTRTSHKENWSEEDKD